MNKYWFSIPNNYSNAILVGDVGAGLGNTANRLALGKGKKATYASEKKAKKEGNKRAAEDSDDDDDEYEYTKPPSKKSKGENGKGTKTAVGKSRSSKFHH